MASEQHILVIGDTILDHDIMIECTGLSLETPTLKGTFDEERYGFGGAANVVNNLLSLGCQVTFITPVGMADDYNQRIIGWTHPSLKIIPVYYEGHNLVKSRYWVNRHDSQYKYLQVNRGTPSKMNTEGAAKIRRSINATPYSAALFVDYRNGFFDSLEKTQNLIKEIQAINLPVICSSQLSDNIPHYKHFENSDLVCLNIDEAAACIEDFEPTLNKMIELKNFLNADVCVTLGSHGSILYKEENLFRHEGYAIEALDTCGAGDAFLAALTQTYLETDISFSNKWAAASCAHRGVYTPSLEDLCGIA